MTTGTVVSTTFTVLVAVPELPDASVGVYVITYDPTVVVSVAATAVTAPEASVAVAPASVYVSLALQ